MKKDDTNNDRWTDGKLAPDCINVEQKDIIKLLGYSDVNLVPEPSRTRISALTDQALKVIEPKYQFLVLDIAKVDEDMGRIELEGGFILSDRKLAWAMASAKLIAVMVATLGEKIDSSIDSYLKTDLAQGFFIDAVASAITEELINLVHREIADMSAAEGLFVGHRYSPGYCSWDLAEQKILFEMLRCRRIGVELSESYLMTPRKSISAVVGIGPDHERISLSPCIDCEIRDTCPTVRGHYESESQFMLEVKQAGN